MDVQKKLAESAFEQMKEKGSMAPLVSRQYLEGKWSTGILLSRMLDMYIARKYGDGWDVDPAQKEQAGAQS